MKTLLRSLVLLLVVAAAVYGVASFLGLDSRQTGDEEAATGPESTSAEPEARVAAIGGVDWEAIDDPAKDGWETEIFADKAKKQLVVLAELVVEPGDLDSAELAKLITSDFTCGPLRPSGLTTITDDQLLRVDRLTQAPDTREPDTREPDRLPHRGNDGLAEAIRAAASRFSDATDLRSKVKIFRVVPSPDGFSTRQFVSIGGRTVSGMIEQHATWEIGWAPGNEGSPPRMRWIRVEEFEETFSRRPEGPLFADCTESVLGGNAIYAEQFLRGANHWFQRIQDPSRFALLGTPGLAVGDVNGDGLDDLYVCQEAGLPNRLFIQQSDGSAREESASWGVDWLESSRSALLADLDNDGDQDLAVAILGGVVVARNEGNGRFRIQDVLSSSEDTMSLSAVDYDHDGRLDLHVCGYFEDRGSGHSNTVGLPGTSEDFVVHDANNGAANTLFRNRTRPDGRWHFVDVTAEVGLDVNNHRYSFVACWDDFDNDGDQDLYVANDYGRDHFYRNELIPGPPAASGSPRFVDLSDSARIEDSGAGMSVTWGDVDRDGWMDVLVSNMWSSAGGRIAYQNQFQQDAPAEIKERFQRLARGNTLLVNRGDGSFEDKSSEAGIEMGRWAWGSQFVDFNLDGWDDLIVSNGYLTTPDTGDL